MPYGYGPLFYFKDFFFLVEILKIFFNQAKKEYYIPVDVIFLISLYYLNINKIVINNFFSTKQAYFISLFIVIAIQFGVKSNIGDWYIYQYTTSLVK
jgi:hypothetical protein